MEWMKELETAKAAAVEAGKAVMEIYREAAPVRVEYKEDRSPLTAADKAANQIIIKALRGGH